MFAAATTRSGKQALDKASTVGNTMDEGGTRRSARSGSDPPSPHVACGRPQRSRTPSATLREALGVEAEPRRGRAAGNTRPQGADNPTFALTRVATRAPSARHAPRITRRVPAAGVDKREMQPRRGHKVARCDVEAAVACGLGLGSVDTTPPHMPPSLPSPPRRNKVPRVSLSPQRAFPRGGEGGQAQAVAAVDGRHKRLAPRRLWDDNSGGNAPATVVGQPAVEQGVDVPLRESLRLSGAVADSQDADGECPSCSDDDGDADAVGGRARFTARISYAIATESRQYGVTDHYRPLPPVVSRRHFANALSQARDWSLQDVCCTVPH